MIILVLFVGYFLSIITWPFALARPFTNVVVSLKEFTNYNIGLRTIFEGEQMMSNMLPVPLRPEIPDDWVSLVVVVPVLSVTSFHGFPEEGILSVVVLHFILTGISRVWVIYQKSNLYGEFVICCS